MGKVFVTEKQPNIKVKTKRKHPRQKRKVNEGYLPTDNIILRYFKSLSNDFGSTSKNVSAGNSTNKKAGKKRKIPTVSETKALESGKRPRLSEEKVIADENQITEKPEKVAQVKVSKTPKAKSILVSKARHLSQDKTEVVDLFYVKEIKSSYEKYKYTDWLSIIIDEICLEGLDGITVEGLWTRLKNHGKSPCDPQGKEEVIWRLICYLQDVLFYILPIPRNKLVIHQKSYLYHADLAILVEPESLEDIYPYKIINEAGTRGSCAVFSDLIEVPHDFRVYSLYQALSLFDTRLVMVGTQKLRTHALMYELCDPCLELTDMEYGVLERIGRARQYGEVTQGSHSLQRISKDLKTIFHVRKSLSRDMLIRKQQFCLRDLQSLQNKSGNLLHLTRFYNARKTKPQIVIEQAVSLLKKQPNYELEYDTFRRHLGVFTGVRRIIKSPEFRKYMKLDVIYAYRQMYPNAKKSEWKCKGKNKEKTLRCIRLKNPNENVLASWGLSEQHSDEESEEEECEGSKLMNIEFVKEIFMIVFQAGKQGITMNDLEKSCDIDFYSIRGAIRKLQARNVIDCVKSDVGRQRFMRYFARCFYSDETINPQPETTNMSPRVLERLKKQQSKVEFPTSSEELLPTNALKVDKTIIDVLNSKFRCLIFTKEVKYEDEEMLSITGFKLNYEYFNIPLFKTPVITRYFEIPESMFSKKNNGSLKIEPSIIIPRVADDVPLIKAFLLNASIYTSSVNIDHVEKLVDNFEGGDNDNLAIFNVFNNVKSLTVKLPSDPFAPLLGPEPHIIREDNEDNIQMLIIESTRPKKYIDSDEYKTLNKDISLYAIERSNCILKILKQERVVQESYKLLKLIDEKNEGKQKMDKKSLYRLLMKLIPEGYVKVFKVTMISTNFGKSHYFICHTSVEAHDPLIRIACDHLKMKNFLGSQKRTPVNTKFEVVQSKKSPFSSGDITSSVLELKELTPSASGEMHFKYVRNSGRKFGFQPKFVRMQILHELLFYLIFDFNRADRLHLHEMEGILEYFEEEERHGIPPIYNKEIGWKMFLSPLPRHQGWGEGWALFCDVILRLPLSILLKMHQVYYEIPGLEEYTQHPIKRHYLVRYLPNEIRAGLLHKRQFIDSILGSLHRLCFIGITQLGPRLFKEKDQLFVFLNRNASILDTTTSGISYHKVTLKDYPVIRFRFDSLSDVEEYWCKLWTISMNTPLGQRVGMEGQVVTIDNPQVKPALMKSLLAKTQESALLCDNGDIPGDQRGAAGLDTTMWAHFRRNWIWGANSSVSVKDNRTVVNTKHTNLPVVPMKLMEIAETFPQQEHEPPVAKSSAKPIPSIKRGGKKSSAIIRRIKATKKHKRYCSDSKDIQIVNRVGKLNKVNWKSIEDKILRLCKVACCFLYSRSHIQYIPFYVIRDVLHHLNPESNNKTSMACQRRINQLFKNDIATKRMIQNAGSLMNLLDISKYFSSLVYELNNTPCRSSNENRLFVAFVYLMSYLYKNMVEVENVLKGKLIKLDYFSPKLLPIFAPLLIKDREHEVFSDPKTEDQIKQETIKSVIHSAVSYLKMTLSWSYQLLKIYQKFPDDIIRCAVSALKNNQIISIKKGGDYRRTADLSYSPFQLSFLYIYAMASTLSTLTFHTVYQNHLEYLGELPNYLSPIPTSTANKYGRTLASNELFSVNTNAVSLIFNVPNSAFVLNQYINDHSELTRELATLYLEKIKQTKKDKQEYEELVAKLDNTEVEQEQQRAVLAQQQKSEVTYAMRLRNSITSVILNVPYVFNKSVTEAIGETVYKTTKSEVISNLRTLNLELKKALHELILRYDVDFKDITKYIKLIDQRNLNKYMVFEDKESARVRVSFFKTINLIKRIVINHEIAIKAQDVAESEAGALEKIVDTWIDQDVTARMKEPALAPPVRRNEVSNCAFYKYNKEESDADHIISNIRDVDEMSVDELMEEMMKPQVPGKTRKVPHVTDLIHLLNNPNVKTTDDKLEKCKSHFLAQYPLSEKFVMTNVEDFKNSYILQYRFNVERRDRIRTQLQRSSIRQNPKDVFEYLRKLGADQEDIDLANAVIEFVHSKGVCGTFGYEIKAKFQEMEHKLALHVIVNALTDCHIFLRNGVKTLTFIHHEFQSTWLIETFLLSPIEKQLLQGNKKQNLAKVKASIEERLQPSDEYQIEVKPWTKVDGSINEPLLEKWLSIILSYCLDYPSITFKSLTEKFCYIKPVDIYFLLEVLQDLNCVDISVFNTDTPDILSEYSRTATRLATCLDRFEDMYIETNNMSTTCLGFYLDKEDIEFV